MGHCPRLQGATSSHFLGAYTHTASFLFHACHVFWGLTRTQPLFYSMRVAFFGGLHAHGSFNAFCVLSELYFSLNHLACSTHITHYTDSTCPALQNTTRIFKIFCDIRARSIFTRHVIWYLLLFYVSNPFFEVQT